MDGTLVDTEPYWMDAELALAGRYGGTWAEADSLHLVGHDLMDSGRYLRDRLGLDLTPTEIVEELLDDVVARVQQDVPWQPGARELLDELAAAGVPMALVTMSWRRFADPVLAALPEDTFGSVVTGDVVARGKPSPDPYLRAAAELGVDPERCLAIEDSATGATSAERAGCLVLVVPSHVEVPAGDRRVHRESLAGLRAADLPVPAATR